MGTLRCALATTAATTALVSAGSSAAEGGRLPTVGEAVELDPPTLRRGSTTRTGR